MNYALNAYATLICATVVLLIGQVMVARIRVLADFNIPEPVAGGLVAAAVVYALNAGFGISFNFHDDLRVACMLMFFASIGLCADFARLKSGGVPLVVFLAIVSVFIVLQNGVGVLLAKMLGLDPLLGLVAGSISLTGGHGTAGAWGAEFEALGVAGATTLGIACATYGLVSGGLIGGPVAKALIKKLPKPPDLKKDTKIQNEEPAQGFLERAQNARLITATSAIETLALFAACLVFADVMTSFAKGHWFELPTFVWALLGGVIIRNVLTTLFNFEMFDRAIDVFGNAALSLFLAIALLSLKLWELAGLGVPILVILLAQTVVMALYAIFVTHKFMGSDYDSAILAAGHCGFGLGATPTAIANMQAVTDRYVPSHKAFLIVPMVGAFFVDIVNATILKLFTVLPFMAG